MNQAVAHYTFWLAFVTPVAWDPYHKCVGSLLQILCGGVLRSKCVALVYVSFSSSTLWVLPTFAKSGGWISKCLVMAPHSVLCVSSLGGELRSPGGC